MRSDEIQDRGLFNIDPYGDCVMSSGIMGGEVKSADIADGAVTRSKLGTLIADGLNP